MPDLGHDPARLSLKLGGTALWHGMRGSFKSLLVRDQVLGRVFGFGLELGASLDRRRSWEQAETPILTLLHGKDGSVALFLRERP